ncbi:MAG TPA: glycosyl hydrolase family 79 C-terminal domain-containing protein [Solirubrobacteraceae bacterium]|nr:glycosyl hydrolase family 79 C-terminal domain-containing protein [Solirubrobacteraceae bacterium]
MESRGIPYRAVAGAAVTVMTMALIAAPLGPAAGGSAPQPQVAVTAWIHPWHPGAPVPARFLGLSFELSSLGQIASYADRGDLAGLLRSLGPGILRFGGASADTRVAWTDPATPRPAWASSVLDAGELVRLRALAQSSGWRVLLTVGLAHFDPRAAAREAAAAKAALGPWLAGIEVGNEPDAYAHHGFRSPPWTYSQYDAQLAIYRRTIARLAPGIPLAGPGVSGSRAFAQWAPREVRRQRPELLTGHHYPLGCHDAPAPTIGRLLSERVRGLEGDSLARYLSVSRASGIGLRVDETNTVSCGGRAGISNTFASALWAVGYIAQTMAAGTAGINFQGNPSNCDGYTPLCGTTPTGLVDGALSPQPEWYALLLTKALVGDRPLRTTLTAAPRRPNVDVTALRAGDGSLHVVIVDDDPPGSNAAAMSLHVGRGFDSASVLALTAPSPGARSGIELGGRAVARDGSWQPGRLGRLAVTGGVATVTVPPASAALVTVQRAPGGAGG